MVQIQEFLPYVLPYAPGCTDPLAEQYIRDVCIDFCTVSSIVQVTLDPIDIVKGEVEYDIETPTGTETTFILAASYRGMPLSIEKDGDSVFLGTAIPEGTPSAVKQTPSNSFTLNRVPQFNEQGAIQMLVATKPSRSAVSMADILLEYGYEIGMGVVARLALIPEPGFPKPQLAPVHAAIYETAKNTARIRAERTYGSAAARVRPRRFM